MDRDEIELTLPGATPKRLRLSVEGTVLTRETRVGSRPPKTGGRNYPHAYGAFRALERETHRRMTDGWVVLGDGTAHGSVLLECGAPPGGTLPEMADLSPDGSTLAFGVDAEDRPGAELHLVDVATGARRLVHTEDAGEMFAVRFTAGATGLVYTLDGRTRRLDLATGEVVDLADNGRDERSIVHPLYAAPDFDAARRRLLVFDADRRATVLGEDGEPLLTVNGGTPWFTGALSASGRMLALVSESAAVEVWDVDAGERVARPVFPREHRVSRLRFHPGDGAILAVYDVRGGPYGVSLDDGRSLLGKGGRWLTDFVPSPDATAFAAAEGDPSRDSWRVTLRDVDTFEPREVPGPVTVPARPRRVVYSDDGSRLACVLDDRRVTVHALEQAP